MERPARVYYPGRDLYGSRVAQHHGAPRRGTLLTIRCNCGLLFNRTTSAVREHLRRGAPVICPACKADQ